MPTKKTDKKTKTKGLKKPKAKTATKVVKQKQKQTQIVNINLAKTTARKAPLKAQAQQKVTSLGNTYYQPVSQAPNAFSLADVAKLIPNYQPISTPKQIIEQEQKSFNIVGSIPNKIPITLKLPEQTIAKPSTEYENLVYTTLPNAPEDLKLKKMVTKKPKKTIVPLPNPPKKSPTLIQKPSNEPANYYERPIEVEERTLTLMPLPQEILRQIQQKNKPRPRLIIEDEDKSENIVTQLPSTKPKRIRRTKQQIEEAKQMEREDDKSYNLGTYRYNTPIIETIGSAETDKEQISVQEEQRGNFSHITKLKK